MRKSVLALLLCLIGVSLHAQSGYVFTSLNTTPAASTSDTITAMTPTSALPSLNNEPFLYDYASGLYRRAAVNPTGMQYTDAGSWAFLTATAFVALSPTMPVTAISLSTAAGVVTQYRVYVRAQTGPGFFYEIASLAQGAPWSVAAGAANWVPTLANCNTCISQIPLAISSSGAFYIQGAGTSSTYGSLGIYGRVTWTAQ